jgi:hypothetical protein
MLKEFAPYIVPLLIVALIVRRGSRATRVRPGRMWIRPAIFILVAGTALLAAPMPGLLVIGGFIVAALVGGGLGYLRASHLHLTIDPQTGQVSSQATTIGTALVGVLFAARFGIKIAFPQLSTPGHGHAGAEIVQWGNGMLIFMVAMLIAQAIWIWRRTRPLLAEHAARTAAGTPPE